MKPIKLSWTIQASPETVWKVLTQAKYIRQWTEAPAKMALKPGGKFSIWGDEIFGVNLEILPEKKLVQSWRLAEWEEDSEVSISLEKKGKSTRVVLVHQHVPAKSLKSITEGWEDYYFGPMKILAESLEA